MRAGKKGYAWLGVLACLACTATAASDGSTLLARATHCLQAKSFLPHTTAPKLEFGYYLDLKSWPGERVLYIVNYPNPSQRGGFVYTVFLAKRDGKQVFNIQNNARFVLSKDGDHTGVSFLDPPLGGGWTQKHLALAIIEIERHPRVRIAVGDINRTDFSVICKAYSDPR